MRIIVLVKQILDPAGVTVRRDKERIFVNREEYIVDPGSKAAVEAALRIRGEDDEVVALSVGEPRADDALREALAMGSDRAYLLSDPAFEEVDVSGTVRILAAAVSKLEDSISSRDSGPGLIVAGRESGDTGAGQIGPRLAQALGYAQVTDAHVMEAGDGAIRVTRAWGESYATVEVSLPAVITVAPKAYRPRYAPGARIMNAYREWDVPVWGLADLGLNAEDLKPRLVFRSETFPPPLEVGEKFRGDPAETAQDVVVALRLQKLIA